MESKKIECSKGNENNKYLSKSSPSNHLQDLKILLAQAHLFHLGCERFGCKKKKRKRKKSDKISKKTSTIFIYFTQIKKLLKT